MSAIVCKELCKTYHQGDAIIKGLDHVNLDIEQGSFICLSGPSGSGKTDNFPLDRVAQELKFNGVTDLKLILTRDRTAGGHCDTGNDT